MAVVQENPGVDTDQMEPGRLMLGTKITCQLYVIPHPSLHAGMIKTNPAVDMIDTDQIEPRTLILGTRMLCYTIAIPHPSLHGGMIKKNSRC